MAPQLRLVLWPQLFAVCRLAPDANPPGWAVSGRLWSVTRSPEELSVVCEQDQVPADVRAERGWRLLQVRGPLDFGLTGILASLTEPLAGASISVFAFSTFDTDYLMVREGDLDQAIATLNAARHSILAATA